MMMMMMSCVDCYPYCSEYVDNDYDDDSYDFGNGYDFDINIYISHTNLSNLLLSSFLVHQISLSMETREVS
jgi:hypothetical protein